MGTDKKNLNIKLTEIRWLTIIAPTLFLILEDLIRHSFFPMPLETHFERGFFYATQFAGIYIFSQYVVRMFTHLLEQTKIQNRQLMILNRVSSELNQSLNMEDELRNSLEVIKAYTSMEYAGILFKDSKDDTSDIVISHAELDWQTCYVITLPLTSNANILGTLKLAGEKPLALDELMTTLTSVSRQISMHIENAQLYRRLQSANDYLNNVIESSGDAIIISDFSGTIRSWNKGAKQIYGYSKTEAIGRILPMVPEEFKEEAFFRLGEIMHGKTIVNWETKRVTATGKIKDINVTVSPLKDERGNIIGVLGISKDVSDKKELEQIIYQRNRDLTMLNQIALELNRSFDREQALQTALGTIRGYLNLEGICLHERLPNETYRLLSFACAMKDQTDECFTWPGQIDDFEDVLSKEEFYYMRTDSGERPSAILALKSKETLAGFLTITENQKYHLNSEARKVLTNFAHQLAVTLENKRLALEVQQLAVLKERERIGMDLHDGIIQSLYGMGLGMEGLLDEKNPDLVKQDLDRYIDQLNEVIQDIRNYIFGLRPHQLANRPLSVGLQDLANSHKVNHLINTSVTIDDSLDGKLGKAMVDHILHIVKEALANVAKHSKATSVEVELKSENNNLLLSVHDDDHEVVRVGLSSILTKKYDVIGEASSAEEAIELIEQTVPDVVIMDVRLPERSGIEACRDIHSKYPHIHVIMLTSYADDEAVFSSIMAGASGYLLKQTRASLLTQAIDTVMQGGSLLDPMITKKVMEQIKSLGSRPVSQTDKFNELTEHEQEILALIAEGLTNKEIAGKIYLSDKTVKNYVSSILAKLNVKRRAEAAALVSKWSTGHDKI